MHPAVHQRTFRVHVYEVDPDGHLGLGGVLDHLQDMALEHADLHGVAVRHLGPRGLTWVMTRYHLRLLSRPPLHEEVLVRTWPSARAGRTSRRELLVTDGRGRDVARAAAEFAVVRLDSGRAVELDEVLGGWPMLAERALDAEFAALPAPDPPCREERFRARWSDVDINQHVNHAVYVTWALEALPVALRRAAAPVEVEIAFRRAAGAGDEVVSAACEADGAFLHRVARVGDGEELVRMRTRWAARRGRELGPAERFDTRGEPAPG